MTFETDAGAVPQENQFRHRGLWNMGMVASMIEVVGTLDADGKRLFSGSADATIKVWDLDAGEER